MLFTLHAPCPKFRKNDLMVVNWPKHVFKSKIKLKHMLLCLTETWNYLFPFTWITQRDVLCRIIVLVLNNGCKEVNWFNGQHCYTTLNNDDDNGDDNNNNATRNDGYIGLRNPDLGTKQKYVVNFTSSLLYHRGKN